MADPTPSSHAPPPPRVEAKPPPATPGVGPRLAFAHRFPRTARYSRTAWRYKGLVFGGIVLTYTVASWNAEKNRARKRDAIPDKTVLYWKLYDGGIVEAKSTGSNLNYLLSSSRGAGAPEEPPRVMELFDVIRTIKFIEQDDRVRGIIADFSHHSIPSVPSYTLGLAQLEEIQDALLELRRVKHEKFGQEGWRTVAWTDTFTSQGQYLLASAFDEVYCQPTGEVPLVGLGSTTPFFGRLAKWLGIEVHAEARNEYKSFYIDEKLTDPQRENHEQLINDLNDNLLRYVGRNRFWSKGSSGSLSHARSLSQVGPFTAREATKEGLLNGTCYRQDVLDSVLDPEMGGDEDKKIMGFYHYGKVLEKAVQKYMDKETIEVGVVYLQGTIGEVGDFGTASVVRGLKEAGEDETIGAVVLRIDSGGGAVVDSDTIWGAVRDLREKYGKTVVASFGNASASGGYWVSTHTDAIFASPSTITGSIGVASLRPTFLQSFFDRLCITLDSFYTGSRTNDPTHSLTPAELERHAASVDEMYDDFKRRVCDGRGIEMDVVEQIAGGRVMSGLRAFEIVAPPELIKQVKGIEDDIPAQGDGSTVTVMEGAATDSTASTGEARGDDTVATLPEDQETSPFAVPEVLAAGTSTSTLPSARTDGSSEPASISDKSASPVSSTPSAASAAVSPTEVSAASAVLDTPEAHAEQALKTASSSADEAKSKVFQRPTSSPPAAQNGAAGMYDYTPGPFGRGLVDGLGGLRDSAVYACQLFIANGIAGYKEEHPDATDEDAVKVLLPDAKFAISEGGEVAMAIDVTLKRFPVQKGLWQQLVDASRRGDSLGDTVSSAMILPSLQAMQATLARWFVASVADSVVEELNSVTSGDGRGRAARMSGKRAEWWGAGLGTGSRGI
ncbi:hypothetical protein BMF94_0977 [Rhodotorula taiwanensis]|uniref:Peptidase S49 domain-containing protein n=1 Tax=Rhodotorula taiwanensis TaxID=741276 RepID=A0A2S5BGK1_9BASI|nr:hypothetical protein BMF94_0977 [Rhodotorula taiwanensis]